MLDTSWILTILIALVTWHLARKWLTIRSLPPGPFPLPIVGNLLQFRAKTFNETIEELQDQYGGIFTVWFGSEPFVLVNDQRLIREGLLEKKTNFAGRPKTPVFAEFTGDNISIMSSDYSRPWEILRKMGQSAIRKYAVSEHLPPLIDELTEETVQKMLKQKEPFGPYNHIYLLIFNVITTTIAGERYQEDDPNFQKFCMSFKMFEKFMTKGLMAYFIPILKPFYRSSNQEITVFLNFMKTFITSRIKQHIATYQPNDIRDMIDSLLFAREEAVAEFGKENASFLNDANLFQVILDIYSAAMDTTTNTIEWLILYVTLHPEVQEKMIQEINDNIGDRVPTQDDRKHCPYTTAVITEVMRMKPIAPYGLPHHAIRDSEIGGLPIPKGTKILFHYGAVHKDQSMWKNPEKFIPERFLESDEQLNDAHRMGQFLAFGTGRRSCVGEKLATQEIFMVVTGIFRRCRLTLVTPPKDMFPQAPFFEKPKDFEVRATRIE